MAAVSDATVEETVEELFGRSAEMPEQEIAENAIFVVTAFNTRGAAGKGLTFRVLSALHALSRRWLFWNVKLFRYALVGGYHLHDVSSRTFGYYHSFVEASDAVLHNTCDLCEGGHYNLAVVEAMTPGIHGEALEMQWYEWVGKPEAGCWVVTERPTGERFDNVVNFGMG